MLEEEGPWKLPHYGQPWKNNLRLGACQGPSLFPPLPTALGKRLVVLARFPQFPPPRRLRTYKNQNNPGQRCLLLDSQQRGLGLGLRLSFSQRTSAVLCWLSYSKEEDLQSKWLIDSKGPHLHHHEMPASLRSDKVALLLRNGWPFSPEYAEESTIGVAPQFAGVSDPV